MTVDTLWKSTIAGQPVVGAEAQRTRATTMRDDIVVYEVMVNALDREWWSGYRAALEKRFVQRELVVRALAVERL